MSISPTAVIRDALAEIDEIQTSKVLRVAAREVVRQMGKAKVQEMARRITAAYIEKMSLPLHGAIARQVALPAMDKMIADALKELEQ